MAIINSSAATDKLVDGADINKKIKANELASKL